MKWKLRCINMEPDQAKRIESMCLQTKLKEQAPNQRQQSPLATNYQTATSFYAQKGHLGTIQSLMSKA